MPNDDAEKAAVLAISKINPVVHTMHDADEDEYLFTSASESESYTTDAEAASGGSNQTSIEDFNG